MTNEQIKDALKWCSTKKADDCLNCPYYAVECFEVYLLRDALKLVTDQENEISRLKAEANKPNYQQKIIELLEDVEETLTRKKWEYEAMARGVLECIKEINQEIEEQKLNERSIKQ